MPDTAGAADLGQTRPAGQPGAAAATEAGPDAPPEWLFRSLHVSWHQVRQIGGRNAAALRELARQGQGISQIQALMDRLEVLVGMLFDISTEQGQAARLEFDARFEMKVAERLEELRKGAASLAAPQLSPGQLAELDRQMRGLVKRTPGSTR